MKPINDNSQMYRPGLATPTRAEDQFQVFLARVLTVDIERKVCTLIDMRSGVSYRDVDVLPASSSDYESTDAEMPTEGTTCLAVPIAYDAGFAQIAILTYTVQDTVKSLGATAVRQLEGVEVLNFRKRGTYRKAFAGEKTRSSRYGYTEKINDGWDRSAKDFSRDRLDPDRREWLQMTSRRVEYTDAGLKFTGPVTRPEATTLTGRTLPDGSEEFVAYLQPGAKLEDRYLSGEQDVIAFVENTERIQEFALDYPLPAEVLQTDLLDAVLGTTADPWARSIVATDGNVQHAEQDPVITQDWDHPYDKSKKPIGPTTGEGPTPQRRAFIIERTDGTLVGYNRFDPDTYGRVLKPVLFPLTTAGRFASSVESTYNPVKTDNLDHVESRLAASASATRFPHEYNTTRWDITKEGLIQFEVGATLPKENIQFAGGYEHPHGAGRSLEAHLVGSLKMVIGKNRDEEDAVDIQALGQMVLRVGADDSSLPDVGRTVMTQVRSKGDTLQKRSLSYWNSPKLKPGDAGDLENKTGAENVSIRGAFDGGTVLRFGARNSNARRRHLVNGYADGPGVTAWAVSDPARVGANSDGRRTYGAGDDVYAFHDLTQTGTPQAGFPPVNEFQQPLTNVDAHGLSLDAHFVRDFLLRVGANPASGQSMLIDTNGGAVMWLGKDKNGRSITGQLDGGITLIVGADAGKKGFRIEVNGDVDWTIKGNKHEHITGDLILEATSIRTIAKTDYIVTAQKITEVGLTRHTTEAPDIVHNQGLYQSDENS